MIQFGPSYRPASPALLIIVFGIGDGALLIMGFGIGDGMVFGIGGWRWGMALWMAWCLGVGDDHGVWALRDGVVDGVAGEAGRGEGEMFNRSLAASFG